MSDLLARLSALFVEPRDGAIACEPIASAVRDRSRERRALANAAVVVLGDARAARAGLIVAAALARGARAPHALLCVWGAPAKVGPALALPATATAAAKLRARGHDAFACGRVVTVALPADEDEALADRARAAAAACGQRDVPVVLALCAARGEALERSLGEHDAALVVAGDGDELVAAVAAARITDQHPGLRVTRAAVGASRRLAAPPRAAARAVLEALR